MLKTTKETVLILLLKRYRIIKGLSMDHLVTKMGRSSQASVSKIENGLLEMSVSNFYAYCKALDRQPVGVLTTVETIVDMLSSSGWEICPKVATDDLRDFFKKNEKLIDWYKEAQTIPAYTIPLIFIKAAYQQHQ